MQVDVHTKKAPFRIFPDFADKEKVSMEHQDVEYLSVQAENLCLLMGRVRTDASRNIREVPVTLWL